MPAGNAGILLSSLSEQELPLAFGERVTFLQQRRKVTKRRRLRHRTSRAVRARCPARLGAGGPARTRASLRSDMRAFPPTSPAMLGAVKGEEDQERPLPPFGH